MSRSEDQAPPAGAFPARNLRDLIEARALEALRSGVLKPLPTEFEFLEEQGIRFLVRILAGLERKLEAKVRQDPERPGPGTPPDPFLPYDPRVFVADVSATHVALLNKFNVLDHHLLLVTRAFEDQESPLTLEDFQALWVCLAELDGLAFYNAGRTAGASQRHKHLQLVPLPLVPGETGIPIQPALETAEFLNGIGRSPGLPYVHGLVPLDAGRLSAAAEAARHSLEVYGRLLQATGMVSGPPGRERRSAPGPYNLLITREWMLLVPRSCECFEGISINALGFAGALLVRTFEQFHRLRDRGPLAALRAVGVTRR
jgi:ATP adenylyltransferase